LAPRRQPPEKKPDWITTAGRIIGLGGIVLSAIFWAATALANGHGLVSTELLGVFGSLWGFSEFGAALKELGRK
jgi:hypothetical protein